MAKAVNPKAEMPYILKEDRALPAEEQTIFYLKPMSARDYYSAQDNVVEVRGFGQREGETSTRILAGKQEQAILVRGIVRWENFTNGDGSEVKWPSVQESEGQRVKALSYLKPSWRRELANVISQEAELGEEQVKN